LTLTGCKALRWCTSSFSTGGSCVETAPLPDGSVAVRNSNRPDAGCLMCSGAEMGAFLAGVKAGDIDDLTP
jgi:hypothetical protein